MHDRSQHTRILGVAPQQCIRIFGRSACDAVRASVVRESFRSTWCVQRVLRLRGLHRRTVCAFYYEAGFADLI